MPDPESPGAILLSTRCGGCHRIYAPESMTAEMWAFQVPRMEERFRQRGMPWLTADEQRQLLEYLTAHAGSG